MEGTDLFVGKRSLPFWLERLPFIQRTNASADQQLVRYEPEATVWAFYLPLNDRFVKVGPYHRSPPGARRGLADHVGQVRNGIGARAHSAYPLLMGTPSETSPRDIP